RASAGLEAAAHGLDEAEAADDGAAAEMAGRKAAGHERSDRRFIARLDAGVRGQMHGRRPAAGHADDVAALKCRRVVAVGYSQHRAVDAAAAGDIDDSGARAQLDAGG